MVVIDSDQSGMQAAPCRMHYFNNYPRDSPAAPSAGYPAHRRAASKYRPYAVLPYLAAKPRSSSAGYKSFHISDLLRAADQQPLPMLDRADELRRLEQRIVGSGVEPGIAAAELDDMKLSQLQIAPIDVGDLQLAAGGRAQPGGDVEHGIVVEVKPGDRPIGQELGGLFDDVDGPVRRRRTSPRRIGSAR